MILIGGQELPQSPVEWSSSAEHWLQCHYLLLVCQNNRNIKLQTYSNQYVRVTNMLV